MNPRKINLDLQFRKNPISNVIPETINKFTLQKNARAFQVFLNKKSIIHYR